MSFFAEYPGDSGGGGGGVSSLNGQTGALALVAGTNVTITPGPGTLTIDATPGSGGANQALSNLTATSINQGLTPDTDSARDLGTTLLRWDELFVDDILATSTVQLDANMQLEANVVTPSGITAHSLFTLSVRDNISVYTANSAVANATQTGQVLILSGNKTAGTGASGDILISTGTSTGGSRGNVILSGTLIDASFVNITNVATPANAADAATKDYVDTAVAGSAGITALTGDVSATGPGSVAATLATVNSNIGAFGTASSVGSFTVNAKGLTTAASNVAIQIAESQVTNLVSDLAGKQPTGNYITALTGDATASGPGSVGLTLATVNANVGSFGSATNVSTFTVNGKGLVTAAGSTAIQIAQSQVTSLTSDLALKAPLASPALTGTPTSPTAAPGTNTTQIASTAFVAAAIAVLPPAITSLIVQDAKTSGTNGGNSSTGMNTRVLNTVQTNTIVGASLSSNQITLPAGTYMVQAFGVAFNCSGTQTFFYNVTDATGTLIGGTVYGATTASTVTSMLSGQFAFASTKVFELRQYVATGVSGNGFGVAAATGANEIYAQVTITKIA